MEIQKRTPRACPFPECYKKGKTKGTFKNLSDHLKTKHDLMGGDRKLLFHKMNYMDVLKRINEHSDKKKNDSLPFRVTKLLPSPEENIYYEDGHSALKFISPTSLYVCGVSQSGKSEFVRKLLLKADFMFTQKADLIVYCYSEEEASLADLKERLPKLIFHHGLPTREDISGWCSTDGSFHTIIVIDDMIQKLVDSQDICYLTTALCHHRNLSSIITSQNVYQQGKYAKTISLNSHYLILFRNPRDNLQIQCVGRQIYPGQNRFFLDNYKRVTARKYGYLVVELSPHANEKYRLRSNVFPEEYPTVYLPIKNKSGDDD